MRQKRRRRFGSGASMYTLAAVALLMIGLGIAMAVQGFRYFRGVRSHSAAQGRTAAAHSSPAVPQIAPWQQKVMSEFGKAAQEAKSGGITNAEVLVDQAEAQMEEARVRSRPATSDFFGHASDALDAILTSQPAAASSSSSSASHTTTARVSHAGAATARKSDAGPDPAGHLFEHVTQARIELAAVRSAQEPIPPGIKPAVESGGAQGSAVARPGASLAADRKSSRVSSKAPKAAPGQIVIGDPRELPAGTTLDPASLGGKFLDASLMPDTAEILLPPETRQFSDNVRVENLTIEGASQTLDGIRWKNVTFIDTRLRYEDGPLDLENVRFIHCTFGFPSDERGASLAGTIALGKTSLAIW